jgi:hypothetical protein
MVRSSHSDDLPLFIQRLCKRKQTTHTLTEREREREREECFIDRNGSWLGNPG